MYPILVILNIHTGHYSQSGVHWKTESTEAVMACSLDWLDHPHPVTSAASDRPFLFRYSRKEVCTPPLNQIPSYLPLEAGWDHRGQLSWLSGPAQGNTDRVNPMGQDWSLDSVAIRLMTGQRSFSPLWPSDRHVDKTCKEGQQLSMAFSPTFLIWTLMSPRGNTGWRHNSSWQDTFSYMLDYRKSIMHEHDGILKWHC